MNDKVINLMCGADRCREGDDWDDSDELNRVDGNPWTENAGDESIDYCGLDDEDGDDCGRERGSILNDGEDENED